MNITRMPDEVGVLLAGTKCECINETPRPECAECGGKGWGYDDELTWFPVIGMAMDEHYEGGGQAPQIIYLQDDTIKMALARGAKVRFAEPPDSWARGVSS